MQWLTACRFSEYRLAEDIQLEDWTRLNGLTGLTLGCVKEGHHGTLAAMLPRLTALQSLVLADGSHPGLPVAGEHCCSDCNDPQYMSTDLGSGVVGSLPTYLHVHMTPRRRSASIKMQALQLQAVQGQQICS